MNAVSITAGGEDGYGDERIALSLRLLEVCSTGNLKEAKQLTDQGADAWIQDQDGSTALHAACTSGNADLVQHLLDCNAVWNITDNAGLSAGDIAYSLNHSGAYEAVLGGGVRSELLKALMRKMMGGSDSDTEDETGGDVEFIEEDDIMEDVGVDGEKKEDETMFQITPLSPTTEPTEAYLPYAADIPPLPSHPDHSDDETEDPVASTSKATPDDYHKSTAGSNKAFLASKLIFKKDSNGQEICEDEEGNGVMMGWEGGIMEETARRLAAGLEGRKTYRGKEREGNKFSFVNVGFGLGIIDTAMQCFHPSHHLIIEPHPDVLTYARSLGFYDLPGVRFYEGTWQQYLADIEDGQEILEQGFDAVYFDTYSEHYKHLHKFFAALPSLLSPTGRFSFFHGLGATSRLFYDVYTIVSTVHLQKLGFEIEWSEVQLLEGGGNGEVHWEGVDRKYWDHNLVGAYRLPIGRMK